MKGIIQCPPKSSLTLAQEWDQIAEYRHKQLATGVDLSFKHVLVPTILTLLSDADPTVLIDIGCGTGELTERLTKLGRRVIGVEPSSVSIKIARANCQADNVQFLNGTLEESQKELQREPVSAAISSMTLMTVPNLGGFVRAVSAVLPLNAKFVATLCHPCFWPRYWDYENEPWFSYLKEIFIEAPFVISRESTAMRTTHIHRPVQQYLAEFASAGFKLEAVLEPMPSAEIEALFPKRWQFPRFLGLRWVKLL